MGDRLIDRRQQEQFQLIFIGIISVVLFGVFSYFSPNGVITNFVFGIRFWSENDPGGGYMASAHELLSSVTPLYFGHPATTLQLILLWIQKLFYLTAEHGVGFTENIATHLVVIYFCSKIVISILHFISFVLLYFFIKRIIRNHRIAILSVLGYATSFPVLFYYSRISVEPIMVICFLATALLLGKAEENIEVNPMLTGVYVSAAAFFSISGLFSKFNMLALLPVWGLLVIVLFGTKYSMAYMKRSQGKLLWCVCYILCTVLGYQLYSQFVNWPDFFGFWSMHTGSHADFKEVLSGGKLTSVISFFMDSIKGLFINRIAGFPVSSYFHFVGNPYPWNAVFLLAECLFISISVVGMALFFGSSNTSKGRMLLPMLFCLYAYFGWLLRGHMTYMFLGPAISSLFFGYAVNFVIERWRFSWDFKRTLIIVACVHSIAITCALNARWTDMGFYKTWIEPFHYALNKLERGEKIGILVKGWWPRPSNLHGLVGDYAAPNQKSILIEEYNKKIVSANLNLKSRSVIASAWQGLNIKYVIDSENKTVVPWTAIPFTVWYHNVIGDNRGE